MDFWEENKNKVEMIKIEILKQVRLFNSER